jgi:hypothetical protein
MKKSNFKYYVALLLASPIGLTLTQQVAAQSLSGAGNTAGMQLQGLASKIATLSAQLQAAAAEQQKLETCQAKRAFYAPAHSGADADGCIPEADPKVGVLVAGGVCTSDGKQINCSPAATASCTLPWGGTLADGKSVAAYQVGSGATCPSEARVCAAGHLSGSYTYASCTQTDGCTWDHTPITVSDFNGTLDPYDPAYADQVCGNICATYHCDGHNSNYSYEDSKGHGAYDCTCN